MNKQVIAGIIFIVIWIILMLAFSPKIIPDYRSNDEDRQCQDFGEGKGCW